jgi:hypothetical protein
LNGYRTFLASVLVFGGGALGAEIALGIETTPTYSARVNYQLQCMGCHGVDGSGEEGRVPSIRRTLVPFSLATEGRQFIVRVPGVAQSALTDRDIALLLNWMARNLSDVPPPSNFADYTAVEVGRFRHNPLTTVKTARERLLRNLLTQ